MGADGSEKTSSGKESYFCLELYLGDVQTQSFHDAGHLPMVALSLLDFEPIMFELAPPSTTGSRGNQEAPRHISLSLHRGKSCIFSAERQGLVHTLRNGGSLSLMLVSKISQHQAILRGSCAIDVSTLGPSDRQGYTPQTVSSWGCVSKRVFALDIKGRMVAKVDLAISLSCLGSGGFNSIFLFPRSQEPYGTSCTRASTPRTRNFCTNYNKTCYIGADAQDSIHSERATGTIAGFAPADRTTSTPDNNGELRDPRLCTQGQLPTDRQSRPDSGEIVDVVMTGAATASAGRSGNGGGESEASRSVQCTYSTPHRCDGSNSSNSNNYGTESGRGALVYAFNPGDGKLGEITGTSPGSVLKDGEPLSPATIPNPTIETSSVELVPTSNDTASPGSTGTAVAVTTGTALNSQDHVDFRVVSPLQPSTETITEAGARAASDEATRCETSSVVKACETTSGMVGGVSASIDVRCAAVANEAIVAANVVRIKDTVDVAPVDSPLPGNNHLTTLWKPNISQAEPHRFGSTEAHIAVPGEGGGGGAKRTKVPEVTRQHRDHRACSNASAKCTRGSSLRQAPRTTTTTVKQRVLNGNASHAVSTKGTRRDSFIAHTLSSSRKGHHQHPRSDAKTFHGASGSSSAKRTRIVKLNTGDSETNADSTAKSGRKSYLRQERQGGDNTKRRSWGAGPGAARFDYSSAGSNPTRASNSSRVPPRRSRVSAAKISPPDSSRPSKSPENCSTADFDVSFFLPTWSALVSEAAWLRGSRADLGGEIRGSDIDGQGTATALASHGNALFHRMGGRVSSSRGGQPTTGEGNRNAAVIGSRPEPNAALYGKEDSGHEWLESTLRARVVPHAPPTLDPEVERLLVKWIRSRIDRDSHPSSSIPQESGKPAHGAPRAEAQEGVDRTADESSRNEQVFEGILEGFRGALASLLRGNSGTLTVPAVPLTDTADTIACEMREGGRDLGGEAKQTGETTGRLDVARRVSTMMGGRGSADDRSGSPQPDEGPNPTQHSGWAQNYDEAQAAPTAMVTTEAPNDSNDNSYRRAFHTSGGGHGSNANSPSTRSELLLPPPLRSSPLSITDSRPPSGYERQCFSGTWPLLSAKNRSVSPRLPSPPVSITSSPTNSRHNAPGTVATSISHTEGTHQYGRGGGSISPRAARWIGRGSFIREHGEVREGDEGRERGDHVSGNAAPSSGEVASGSSGTSQNRNKTGKLRDLSVAGGWTDAIDEENKQRSAEGVRDALNPSPHQSVRNKSMAKIAAEKGVEGQEIDEKAGFHSDDERNVTEAVEGEKEGTLPVVVTAADFSSTKERDAEETDQELLHLLDVGEYESDFEAEGRE